MAVDLKVQPQSVAGLIPVSMVDWEGKLAAIVFLAGCNLRCPYCHNPELIKKDGVSAVPWQQVADQLSEKKGWVDGVVITGGEPTVCDDLESIIRSLRELGLPIKLDTNGTRPEVVKDLIAKDLLDYLAIDIKAAFNSYEIVTRVKGAAGKVKETAELAVVSGLDHEFRTTVVPGFVESRQILEIAAYLAKVGAKRYFLQQFNPKTVLETGLAAVKPFPPAFLEELAGRCGDHLPTKVRGAL